MVSPVRSHACFFLILLMSISTPVHAQSQRPERPFRGLFGSGSGEWAQSLVVNGSIGGGWDSSIAADIDPQSTTRQLDPAQTPGALRGAGFNLFSGSIAYSFSGDRFEFATSTATSGRYYRSLSSPLQASHSARLGLGYRAGRSTQLTFGETVSYQPFGSLDVFPQIQTESQQSTNLIVALAPSFDLRALGGDYFSSTSDFGVGRQLSQRTTISGSYSLRSTQFGAHDDRFTSHRASGGVAQTLTQHLTLRLGYGYTTSNFAADSPHYQSHQLDSGVSYNRALSISRRTTVSFDTGGAAVADGQSIRVDVIGGAQIVHEMGRSWTLSSILSRSVGFVETLNQPLFSNAVNLSLSGLPSRIVQVNVRAGASNGSLGIARGVNGLLSYYGSTGVGLAFSRYASLQTTYNYYNSALDGDIYRMLGFPATLGRHSFAVSVAVWAPIIQKGRRTNAPR